MKIPLLSLRLERVGDSTTVGLRAEKFDMVSNNHGQTQN